MQWLFKSLGVKRYLSAVISGMAGILAVIPGTNLAVLGLQSAAAVFGVAGTAHSTVASTFNLSAKDVASILSVVIIIARQFPILAPYAPILEAIAIALGGATISKGIERPESVIAR